VSEFNEFGAIVICQCASVKPGISTRPSASITRVPWGPFLTKVIDAVKKMSPQVTAAAHAKARKIGICRKALSDYLDFAVVSGRK
jgi:hypothetical protein